MDNPPELVRRLLGALAGKPFSIDSCKAATTDGEAVFWRHNERPVSADAEDAESVRLVPEGVEVKFSRLGNDDCCFDEDGAYARYPFVICAYEALGMKGVTELMGIPLPECPKGGAAPVDPAEDGTWRAAVFDLSPKSPARADFAALLEDAFVGTALARLGFELQVCLRSSMFYGQFDAALDWRKDSWECRFIRMLGVKKLWNALGYLKKQPDTDKAVLNLVKAGGAAGESLLKMFFRAQAGRKGAVEPLPVRGRDKSGLPQGTMRAEPLGGGVYLVVMGERTAVHAKGGAAVG